MIIPILSGLTSFLTSFISMKMVPGMNQQSGMMKGMMYGMPLFSLFIAFSVPVGVAVYWIAGNLLAIVQTVVLNKFYSPARYKAEYEEQVRKVEEQKKAERGRAPQAQRRQKAPRRD